MQSKLILKILIKWSSDTQQFSAHKALSVNKVTYLKVISRIMCYIKNYQPTKTEKMGGPDTNIQVNEMMINFKCKSHRGRTTENKTDALCIIEYTDDTIKAYATTIPNISKTTIIPIICSRMVPGSIVHTYIHKSYVALVKKNFIC